MVLLRRAGRINAYEARIMIDSWTSELSLTHITTKCAALKLLADLCNWFVNTTRMLCFILKILVCVPTLPEHINLTYRKGSQMRNDFLRSIGISTRFLTMMCRWL
jgi:hypothetical protein